MAQLPRVAGSLSDATKLRFSNINSQLAEMLFQNVITDDFANLDAWTEVDGDAKVNLSGGVVTMDGGNAWDTHGIRYTNGFTRAAGYFEFKVSGQGIVANLFAAGITNSAVLFKTNTSAMCGVAGQSTTTLNVVDATAYQSSLANITLATWYTLRLYVGLSGDGTSWKKLRVTIQGGVYTTETDVGVFNQIITELASTIYFSLSRYVSNTNAKVSFKEFRWYSGYATDAPYVTYTHDAGAGKVFDNFDPSALAMPGTVPDTNLTFKWSFDDGVASYSTEKTLAELNAVAKVTEQHRYIRLQVILNSDGATQVYADEPNSATATDGIVVPGGAPSKPVISARVWGSGKVRIDWTASANTATYTVKRGGVEVQAGLIDTTFHIESGLSAGTYSYTVEAVGSSTIASDAVTVTAVLTEQEATLWTAWKSMIDGDAALDTLIDTYIHNRVEETHVSGDSPIYIDYPYMSDPSGDHLSITIAVRPLVYGTDDTAEDSLLAIVNAIRDAVDTFGALNGNMTAEITTEKISCMLADANWAEAYMEVKVSFK